MNVYIWMDSSWKQRVTHRPPVSYSQSSNTPYLLVSVAGEDLAIFFLDMPKAVEVMVEA